MKTRKALEKYFKKRTDTVESLMQKPDKLFTAEDFHRLRVEIKKMRALVAMLESSVKTFKSKKVFKPVKKIFGQAGKVREIQLEESMLRKHDPQQRLKTYPYNLHLRELREKKDFSELHKKVQGKLKKTYARIIPIIRKARKSDVKKYIKRQKKEITLLVKPATLKVSQVHELRKGLKRFYYTMKSLDLKNKSTVFKNGDALQDMMGKWHDSRVMNRHLSEAADKHLIPPPEKEPIMRIADKLDSKSRMLYKKINTEKRKKII